LYRHPERQGPPDSMAEAKYNIGHDIYRLGVCLLEIGLWQSFVEYAEQTPKLSSILVDAKNRWKEENEDACQPMTESAIELNVFVELAATRLVYEMGEAYCKFVDSSSRDGTSRAAFSSRKSADV